MIFTEEDIHLFNNGSHYSLYEKMGAHPYSKGGYSFVLWCPHAQKVSVIGDFNEWNDQKDLLHLQDPHSSIWEGIAPNAFKESRYKFKITLSNGTSFDKSDPFAFFCEQPPGNASILWSYDYLWESSPWEKKKKKQNSLQSPMAIYEIHLPSWKRNSDENNRPLTYTELAAILPNYLKEMGFTHVEFLPIMEHPLYSSWGYQTLGYFAPCSRYGTPQDFMWLIESLQKEGIGVILDWVPSHFPADSHGLASFDGTHLYEYQDSQKRKHPDWHTYIFDYQKPQVRSFLISNAFFWLSKYHADALRFDAVASMLYLDYSRKKGEWTPNAYGGRENLEAVDFLKTINREIYANFPYAQTIAEESTDWPLVSKPTYLGGLGFGMKWNLGWMHDTLKYMALDPIYRKYHHDNLLFSIWYAYSENFILSLSHDEVVHGKGSLIRKMHGDDWQKYANLRLLYGYMYGHPGKKLLFMGSEIAQWNEWGHEQSIDWHLLQYPMHKKMQKWIQDLNHFYQNEPCLYEEDFTQEGFEWVDTHAWEESLISFIRKSPNQKHQILVICNFTPIPRINYRLGVPQGGYWKELLNSNSEYYGGSDLGNYGGTQAKPIPSHGRPFSLLLTIPPLSTLFFKSI